MSHRSQARPRAGKHRERPFAQWRPSGRPLGKLRTISQTAEILQTSERTVQRLIADGRLRAHRIGRLVRITDDDVAALLDATESL
ncbi:helix-turn-helix domain-containing protein [Bradyrhizobium sp.]|uniref:helix-turn-helix domain-containing protein n=1 Tax=Bradyrhizobium sp. TaxID=376 RepID=UPI003C6EB299